MPYKDPAKRREKVKERRNKDKDKTNQLNREWYATNSNTKKIQNKVWWANNITPEKQLNYTLKKMYNITLEDYNNILNSQESQCAICKGKEPGGNFKRFLIDHCHTTGKIRGLLCLNCNTMLGHSKDNILILTNAIKYLNKEL